MTTCDTDQRSLARATIASRVVDLVAVDPGSTAVALVDAASAIFVLEHSGAPMAPDWMDRFRSTLVALVQNIDQVTASSPIDPTNPASPIFDGLSIAQWARDRGFNIRLVYSVLRGERKCLRGESYRIAKALGIK